MLGALAMMGRLCKRFFDHGAPNLLAVTVLAIRFIFPFWIASDRRSFVFVKNFASIEQGTVMTRSAGVCSLAKAFSTSEIVWHRTTLAFYGRVIACSSVPL